MFDFSIVGKKYGRLTVLGIAGKDKSGHTILVCQCDCGKITNVLRYSIVSGIQVSCGCYMRELSAQKCRSRKKYNTYDLTSESYGIGYTHNTDRVFYFDKEDYDLIKNYCWREDNNGYIVTNQGVGEILCLHRLVTHAPDDMEVDHKRHQLFDNRKESLRVTRHCDNLKNLRRSKRNKSGRTGVCLTHGKWQAYITINSQRMNLGYYINKEDAIRAREEAEEKYFGEYSYKNSQIIDNKTKN